MAAFVDSWVITDKAYFLLQNGAINVYRKQEILDDEIDWLIKDNYEICRFDASLWKSESDFHKDMKIKLNFPDYYWCNLDAFNDCMFDVQSSLTWTVIVIEHYDIFKKFHPHISFHILDIFEINSRLLILFGRRLIILLQVDDPNFSMDWLWSRGTNWNRKEWFIKDRGL